MVFTERLRLNTRGNGDTVDVTPQVTQAVARSGIKNGIVTVFAVGSTAGVTTIEYEPGLVEDLQAYFERVAPRGIPYRHHLRWGDDNGHSHVRAAVLGPSVTVPVIQGELALGAWQQLVLVDFDTRPRQREVVLQIVGGP